jgi:hypothetical protein
MSFLAVLPSVFLAIWSPRLDFQQLDVIVTTLYISIVKLTLSEEVFDANDRKEGARRGRS